MSNIIVLTNLRRCIIHSLPALKEEERLDLLKKGSHFTTLKINNPGVGGGRWVGREGSAYTFPQIVLRFAHNCVLRIQACDSSVRHKCATHAQTLRTESEARNDQPYKSQ